MDDVKQKLLQKKMQLAELKRRKLEREHEKVSFC